MVNEKALEWYSIKELIPGLYQIDESGHVSFYIFKFGREGLLIDSGLGLIDELSKELLRLIGLDSFTVLCTHSHCDHVGMNYLSIKCLIVEAEWKKYLAKKEIGQTTAYYRILKDEDVWPAALRLPPAQHKWQPSDYLRQSQIIKFGKWEFEVRQTPGHTCGHAVFIEKNNGLIFCGDLIYDGEIYLNLPDSSFRANLESISTLSGIVKSLYKALLLPSHNRSPLKASYIDRYNRALVAIENGQFKPNQDIPSNEIFLDSYLFNVGGFKIFVRKDDKIFD